MPRWSNKIGMVLVMLFVVTIAGRGQDQSSDFQLIKSQLSNPEELLLRPTRPFPKGFFLPLGAAMWVYQNFISPHLTATCLYHPSCSTYSIELLRRYGTFAGIIMTADRITRCNRLVIRDIPIFKFNHTSGKIDESTDYYQWTKPVEK